MVLVHEAEAAGEGREHLEATLDGRRVAIETHQLGAGACLEKCRRMSAATERAIDESRRRGPRRAAREHLDHLVEEHG
jgi:hypothetical protein